jgi:hypothetical protein
MTPELRDLARKNLGAYHLTMNPKYQYVRFQQEAMVPALHKVATHEIEALMILMPFRHGKSEIGTLTFSSWLFGVYPDRKNMVLSYSDDFAEEFGGKILKAIQTDVYKEIFPETQLSRPQTSKYFRTTVGGEFRSAGFNGRISGIGVNGVLIIDDPLKNYREATSPSIIKARMEDYHSAANLRLEKASKVLITNRWCKGDFVDRVLDTEGEISEGGKWTILRLAAEAEEDDPIGRKPGEFLWPEERGEKWYFDNKKGPKRIWTSMCQQDPQPDQGRFFKREWLCFYPRQIRPGKFPAYMLTDPAKGKDVGHDRTAIGVFVTTPDRRILLVDAVLARLDPDERAQECFRLVKKWQPRKWLYEEYGLLSDTWYLEQRAKQLGIRTKPIPVGRKGRQLSKESRIEALIPDFREGRIWLPDIYGNDEENRAPLPFPTMLTDGDEEISIVQNFIDSEYLEYAGENSTPYDDFLDMISRLHAEELSLSYPQAPMQEIARSAEYRNNRPAGTGWESLY